MAWSAGAILTAAQLNTYLPQTWTAYTPTLSTSGGAFTTTSRAGRYIQYGKTVHFEVVLTLTNVGTALDVSFTLPVASLKTTGHVAAGRETAATGKMIGANRTSSTVAKVLDYTGANVAVSGYTLTLTGTYEAA